MITQQTQVQSTAGPTSSWESLIPTSFKDTVYLASLKISVTAGSFIRYRTSEDQTAPKTVGRIVQVVPSKDLVDGGYESHPLLNLPIPIALLGNEIPVQFAKVNIFKDRRLLCDSKFPLDAADDHRFRECQNLVQLNECEWIPSYLIDGLAFVATEHDAILRDDCQGMCDFFVVKYRIARNGSVCVIPRHSCPPFPRQIEGFSKLWEVDSCELIFKSMLQIRQEMQRILCRVAQSQGDFAVKNAKLHLPNCCWFFIKNFMETKGIDSVSGVQYSQSRSSLAWGLAYYSRRYTGYLDVLRFDTLKKLRAFRALFGTLSGYGVRKKRPRYSDGHSHLCLNDVLNVVVCHDSAAADENDDTSTNEASQSDGSDSSHQFQRFGVTDDGIDLAYDSSDGLLQIVLRYRKVVVTEESLPSLVGVGVLRPEESLLLGAQQGEPQPPMAFNIVAGMEFIDDSHVMRVQEVCSSEIRAKTIYKIHDATKTSKVANSEIIIYNDIAYVSQKIQQMLE